MKLPIHSDSADGRLDAMRPVGPARHCQAYVLFGLCIGVQLSSRGVVALLAGKEQLTAADALRWHVLLRKPTIVERLDCERLPTNRAHVRRGTRTLLTVRFSAEIKPIALLLLY